MGGCFFYENNALFPKTFFKRLWSGLVISMVNFYKILLVILTVNCGDFYQGLRTEKFDVELCNTLQHTLCNFDGELW